MPVAVGSPPWIMNSGITRWKTVPLYKDLLRIFFLVAGSVQTLVPSARPTKLATVSGDSCSKSLQVMRPMLVSKTAVGPVGCRTTGALEAGASGKASAAGGVDC